MNSSKYIGIDLHKDSISVAVRNPAGKIVMESVIETKASMILQFIDLIDAGLVAILAFVVRLWGPSGLDIYAHDTYRVVPLGIVGFWVLLAIATAWLVIAALKLIRRAS